MKILGLDIGFARVGFATGDSIIQMAFPKEVIGYDEYIKKIHEYIYEYGIEKIVIGIPNTLDDQGQNEDHKNKILGEIERVKHEINIPVEIFDERYSSRIAQQSLSTQGVKSKKQKEYKDAMAAAIILQGWLDMN